MSTGEHTPAGVGPDDDLAPEEREALDAFVAPEPPADLAARVLARAAAEARPEAGAQLRPGRRPALRWVALAAGLIVVLGLAFGASRLLRSSRRGDVELAERTTLDLGGRATAVAEAGSALAWRVSLGGAARIEQRAGNVFYRVERGGPFVVETPLGAVEVQGTCFRVEVSEMRASRASLIGAAAGAAVATAVLVTVYEGKVVTAAGGARTAVAAGQAARLESGRAPQLLAGEGTGKSAGGEAEDRRGSAALSLPELRERNQALSREAQRLRGELEVLQQKLRDTTGQARQTKTFDLSKEELKAMADRCELRWDMPSLSSDAPQVPSSHRKELGLNATEVDAVNKILAEHHRQAKEQLRKLYVEVTGDSKIADSLSPEALRKEIEDKSTRDETKQVFQRLARERAGLQAPPASLAGTSPVERLYRMLTTAGDRVEAAVGAQLGPDLAHRYREAKGGFGDQNRSSYGCP